MIHKILFLSTQVDLFSGAVEILEKKLEGKDIIFELEIAHSLEERMEQIRKNRYTLIIAEYGTLAENGFCVFDFPISTKIYSLKNNKELDATFEETVLRGAQPIITEFADSPKIADVILPKIEETRFFDSYTNLLIDSMIEMESVDDVARMMNAYGKTICRQYDIKGTDKSDILRVLSILSLSFKNKSLIKTIRFFERMRVAEKIVKLLREFLEPSTKEGYILHAIYKHTQIEFFGNKNHDDCASVGVPDDIHRNIIDTIKKHKVYIEKGHDLELIWIKIIEALNHTDADKSSYDDFMKLSMRLVRYIICYTTGGVINIEEEPKKLSVEIIAGETLGKHIDKLFEDYHFGENICIDIDGNTIKLTIDTNITEVVIEKPITTHSATHNGKMNILHLNNRIITSAISYIDSLEHIEDIYDIAEALEGYEDMAERIITSGEALDKEALLQASEVILKYGTFLSLQNEFRDLAYVLTTLTSILKNAEEKHIGENQDKIYVMLTSIIDDLRSWKKNIFIEKTARDIHYLDDSLYSSCLQLEKLLNGEVLEAEDDELELF